MPAVASPITSSMRFSHVLQMIGHAEARSILSRRFDALMEGEDPDLSSWPQHIVDSVKPITLQIWQFGMLISNRRTAALQGGWPIDRPSIYRPLFNKGVMKPENGRMSSLQSYHERRRVSPLSVAKAVGGSRLGYQFDLFRPEVLDAVDHHTFQFARSTTETATRDLKQALQDLRKLYREGLPRGDAVAYLAKEIYKIFSHPYRAYTIATTETSRFVNMGSLMAAKANPVVTGKEWEASPDACKLCLKLSGRVKALDKPFFVDPNGGPYAVIQCPPAHPHCLLPETPINVPAGIAGIKAHFDGPVTRIDLAGGSHITVTSHHIFLTPQGFVMAGGLREGDDLLRYTMPKTVRGSNPDNNRQPPSIEQVFDSWAETNHMTTTAVPVSSEYLHGDGEFCKGDINVVPAYSFLRNNVVPQTTKPLSEHYFIRTMDDPLRFNSQSDLTSVLLALRAATDGGMSSSRTKSAFFDAVRRVPSFKSSGSVFHTSYLNSRLSQPTMNNSPTYPVHTGKRQFVYSRDVSPDYFGGVHRLPFSKSSSLLFCPKHYPVFPKPVFNRMATHSQRLPSTLERFSSQISRCQIVKISRFHYAGPVYDVMSATSMYTVADGVIASNCFCTFTEVL